MGTATTITVLGDIRSYVQNGDAYRVVDYHLDDLSGAIDTGRSGGVPANDVEGKHRPVDVAGLGADGTGTESDIGALEDSDTGTYVVEIADSYLVVEVASADLVILLGALAIGAAVRMRKR